MCMLASVQQASNFVLCLLPFLSPCYNIITSMFEPCMTTYLCMQVIGTGSQMHDNYSVLVLL